MAMPGRRLYFLLGADKLTILPRWHNIEDFLSEFGIAVVGRDGTDAMDAIRRDRTLSRHAGNFVLIDELEDMPDVSSGKFQELLLSGSPEAADLVTKTTYETALRAEASREPVARTHLKHSKGENR